MGVERVHVVAKAHLDLGFTALASEVAARYLTEWFPAAIATAAELRARGGQERLVWTTGSWILHRALGASDEAADPTVAAAVGRGDLAWHALPLTTHTELMDAELVRSGLRISQDLDARFDRPATAAAKLTDVPGHTRGLVPLLAEAGVTFLHIGVNPAWPVPEVPAVFRWRSPDGSEVVVAYQSGGYGGEVIVLGCPDALVFLHAGDNGGPPSANEVVAAHAEMRARFPGAEVRASTLHDFARALAASGAAEGLPVVTAEIGDPWIFGAASDPQKVAAYRELLRRARARPMAVPGPPSPASVLGAPSPAGEARCSRNEPVEPVETDETAAIDRSLLLVAEHTWGLDQKEHLPDWTRWDRAGLAALRASDAGRRFEASWAEQRAYVIAATDGLGVDVAVGDPFSPRTLPPVGPTTAGSMGAATTAARSVEAAPCRVRSDTWEVDVGDDGSLRHLVHRPSGRVLANPDHPLGLLSYQSFDEADYERFFTQLTPEPHDVGWARLDNTKPGIDAAGAVSGRWSPRCTAVEWCAGDDGAGLDLLVQWSFTSVPDRLGVPREARARWFLVDGAEGPARIDLEVGWPDKPASRLPEALWCSFEPVVAEPDRWTFEKLGQQVSPLDVVRHGGRSLHAVGGGGCTYDGSDGRLQIRTHDAPLVAPGAPNLLDADPPLPDLAGGLHVLLYDNCWGTNFPMWSEGPAQFRFTLNL